jgi:hypothetical protein
MKLRTIILVIGLSIVFGWGSGSTPATAQSAITVGEPTTINNFPDSLTFRIPASSSAGEIVSADLYYSFDGFISSPSHTREQIEFEPASQVDLEFEWDTEGLTTPPGMPISYYWRIRDSAGNQLITDSYLVRYEDIRYDWQILEDEYIGVWWHDKPASFGQSVFNIAERAIEQQRALFDMTLDYQIRIIIYNSDAEFHAWHAVQLDWVGGEAFSDYGITTQIVYGSQPGDAWLQGVVPHEISHLYFAPVTRNPSVSVPHWLNEGVAQYNEFIDNSYALTTAQNAAARGELIHLSSLAEGFGSFDEARVRLAYAESLSAVNYLVETYGEEGLAAVLTAYREGHLTEEAFEVALGVPFSQFEGDWAVWLGVPEGEYITPTPWAMPAFPATPTMFVPGSGGGSSQEEATPEPEIAATETQEPDVETADEGTEPEQEPGFTLCSSTLLPAFVGVGFVYQQMRRRNLGV